MHIGQCVWSINNCAKGFNESNTHLCSSCFLWIANLGWHGRSIYRWPARFWPHLPCTHTGLHGQNWLVLNKCLSFFIVFASLLNIDINHRFSTLDHKLWLPICNQGGKLTAFCLYYFSNICVCAKIVDNSDLVHYKLLTQQVRCVRSEKF